MRREAEREVARINLQLREQSTAERQAASAAERLALKQALESLQQTLGTKEQALETITRECRRLEDVLEDQHLVFDGLRKEVERRDDSLMRAQEEVERLRQSLLDLQSQAPLVPTTLTRTELAEVRHQPGRVARSLSPLAGLSRWLLIGPVVLLLLVGAIWLRLSAISAPPDEPPIVVGDAATTTAESPGAAPATAEPQRPPTTRDRLRDGSFGPLLSRLPAGQFRMGHSTMTANDFGPVREVTIAPFYLGVYEITFAEYDRFARATGRALPNDFGRGRDAMPVVGVSWNDANAYVNWLARESGRAYRLPSEAEWEYAARAGGRGSYWWGFGLERNSAVCFDCGSAWDNRSPAPVGSFPASPFGLHDTAGNVMEWVADCYHPSYEGAPVNGSARLDGRCAARVARGGAFNRPSSSMRAYVRDRFEPATRLDMLGFRVARD